MTDIQHVLDEAAALVAQDAPTPAEIRSRMVELDDLIHSPEFQALSADEKARIQTAYKELRDCLRNRENHPSIPSAGPAGPGYATSLPDQAVSARRAAQAETREHNPYAEQQMEEAERLFYGGRYAEAIKLYDQVIQIEPGWERAKQHRNESEGYLRTGYIPSVALPADAASAFGKAQSAARLGRYVDAMALLTRAQNTLREMGIQRWQEGQEFEQKLQQYIDAESVYGEGLQYFNQGNVEEGIDRVETAAQATGLPKYNDKAQELRRAKASMQAIAESLNSLASDPKAIAEVKTGLDGLYLQYGDNPAFFKLKERLDKLTPHVIEPMKDQVRLLKTQADQAQTLDAALSKARQAKQILDQARTLGPTDDGMTALAGELDKLFREVQRYQDNLTEANTVYNTNRSWPAAADRISRDVRARYPNDPGVIELNRSLSGYHNSLLGIKAGGIIIGIIIIGLLIRFGLGKYNAYVISLTPTATPTATLSPTQTPLPPTSTNTPQPTLTPSLTPTPLMGTVQRQVWVRKGCYENFEALGKIPAGGPVRFLDNPRAYDPIGRECLLVQYSPQGQPSLIGWILIADLGQ
jgi:tetratricopeptide (TPR) repeat protein